MLRRGKRVVAKTGCKHTIIELDECGEPRNGDVQRILAQISNIRTVPQIFIAGRSVGGGDDIEKVAQQQEAYTHDEKPVLSAKINNHICIC